MYESDFITQVRDLDLIDETVLAHLAKGDAGFHNQISRWARTGLLERISKGRYILSRKRFGQKISNLALASRILPDSYVSGITLLSLEMMVPEAYTGHVVTNITSGKPRKFESEVGTFEYRHIKRPVYASFHRAVDDFGKPYQRATPTKALLDYLYLETAGIEPSTHFLESGLRLQKVEKIDTSELKSFLGKYSTKMDQWISATRKFKRENRS